MGVSIFVMLAVDDHYLDPLEIIKWWYFIIPFFFFIRWNTSSKSHGRFDSNISSFDTLVSYSRSQPS